jgi:hypothetical protein
MSGYGLPRSTVDRISQEVAAHKAAMNGRATPSMGPDDLLPSKFGLKLGAAVIFGVAKKPTTLTKEFFRGAKPGASPSFVPKPGEFKIDPLTGSVKPTHGVSVFDNAESVVEKGMVPHKVDKATISPALQVKQRGADPSHFEITPADGINLTPQEFIKALECIKCR